MTFADDRWLPSTPPSWTRSHVRHLCRVETGSRDTIDALADGEFPFFVRSETPLAIDDFAFDTEAVLTPGDGDVGRIFHHFAGRFNAHQRVYVFHDFRGVIPRFFYWWMLSQFHHVTEQGTAKSTVASLRRPMLVDFPVLVPPTHHQRAIADFLDHETAQIDAMIEAQGQLVRALTARRALTITEALLFGLDEAELDDTGVPWLGKAPTHWEVRPLKHLGRAIIGLSYAPEDVVDESDNSALVLRAGNIQGGRLIYDDCVFVDSLIPPAKRLRDHDLLICSRNGSARLIGKSALIQGRAVGHTWGAFMTVFRSPVNDYIYWVLNSALFERQLGLFATSTINQLTTGMLHNMRIAIPPRDEQLRIIGHIETAVAKIDDVLLEAGMTIALLNERREALINAAVTGRIDPETGIERVDPTTEKEAS